MANSDGIKRANISPLASFRGGNGELDGVQLTWVYDQRSAADILVDWMNHAEKQSIAQEAFISECLDLEGALSLNDISSVIAGEQGIGSNLALQMSMKLPPEIATRRVFLNRCGTSRRQTSDSCDISDETLSEKRNAAIDAMLDAAIGVDEPPNEVDEENTPTLEPSPLYNYISHCIRNMLKAHDMKASTEQLDAMVENIASKTGLTLDAIKYGKSLPDGVSAEQAAHRLAEVVSAGDASVFDAVLTLGSKHLLPAPEIHTPPQLGDVIRLAREYQGEQPIDVARSLSCTHSTSYFWEYNQFSPSATYAQPLMQHLKLSHEQQGKVLDILIGDTQPAGSLGHFIRKHKLWNGFTTEALAHNIGCTIDTMKNWENNENTPSPKNVKCLVSSLALTDESLDEFSSLLITESIEPDSLGYFIQKHRMLAGLTTSELAERVGCSAIAINKWESNTFSVSDQFIPAMSQALALDESHADEFMKRVREARGKERGNSTQTLGSFIRDERMRLGKTAQVLAQEIGCSDKAIHQWEADDALPYDKYLPPLALGLGLSSDKIQTLHGLVLQNHPSPNSVGYHIKKHRLNAGITAEALAEALGASVAVVNKWERNASPPHPNFIPSLITSLSLSDKDLESIITTEEATNTVGGFFEFHRKKAGFTQESLSKEIGKSRPWIKAIEQNKSKLLPEHIGTIISALGMAEDDSAKLHAMVGVEIGAPATDVSDSSYIDTISQLLIARSIG